EPIGLTGFENAVYHFQMDKADVDYPRYKPKQIVEIAENVLLYQTKEGGWPKNIDWLRVLSVDERNRLRRGARPRRATFDNHNTWSQIVYLAWVHQRTGLQRYADAALRGIDYVFTGQHPQSGGWRGWDVDAITFNDHVMAEVTKLMREVGAGNEPFAFVDADRRAKARRAYERALECILKCQIEVNGKKTAWCQQHSHRTYRPIWARTFEPPSICGDESVRVIRLLMAIEQPSDQVVDAIESAVAWYKLSKMEGLRLEQFETEPVRFEWHLADYDRRLVEDPDAAPLWARFYSLEDGVTPLWPDKNRVMRKSYNAISRDRRTGYRYVGTWGTPLLEEDYPAWKKRMEESGNR
ncbi:MAG: pectate lyase, partial [Rhodospirillales bacterium]|nr:pectate lyase [Rhodospirillales bacterium]